MQLLILLGLVLLLIHLGECNVYVKELPVNSTVLDLIDKESLFAPVIVFWSFSGYLVSAQPLDACSPILPAPSHHFNASSRDPLLPFFVLISRGNCSYDRKVYLAQDAGYEAVIVFNNKGDDMIAMGGGQYSPYISIPAVMVGLTSGIKLSHYTFNKKPPPRFFVVISSNFASYAWYYFYAFLGLLSICLFIIVIFLLVNSIRNWYIRQRNRLSWRHLRKIPQRKFKKGDDIYETCAICLDDYEDGEKLRILPCQHAYHSKCIDPWLLKNHCTCPVCKRPVRLPGFTGGDDSDTDERAPLLGAGAASAGGTFDEGPNPLLNRAVVENEVTIATPSVQQSAPEEEDPDEVKNGSGVTLSVEVAVHSREPMRDGAHGSPSTPHLV